MFSFHLLGLHVLLALISIFIYFLNQSFVNFKLFYLNAVWVDGDSELIWHCSEVDESLFTEKRSDRFHCRCCSSVVSLQCCPVPCVFILFNQPSSNMHISRLMTQSTHTHKHTPWAGYQIGYHGFANLLLLSCFYILEEKIMLNNETKKTF